MSIPTCPFCWGTLSYPEDIRLSETDTVLGGRCFLCDARYIVDVTGKNVGEAMVHGLEMAARELGKDLAMLESGEDYDDFVLRYDAKQHQTLGLATKYRDRYARLYVIKIRKNSYD